MFPVSFYCAMVLRPMRVPAYVLRIRTYESKVVMKAAGPVRRRSWQPLSSPEDTYLQ